MNQKDSPSAQLMKALTKPLMKAGNYNIAWNKDQGHNSEMYPKSSANSSRSPKNEMIKVDNSVRDIDYFFISPS
jgi:hypothetical protein